MRILLVDDDELLVQMLAKNLTEQHYAVDIATDGEKGWDFAQAVVYDLIVLDINLPKLDGIRLCQRLRQNGYKEPILLLTAKGGNIDKVIGLDAGADDYVVKPCSVEELSARMRALLRRQHSSSTPLLEWGSLCLNPSTCQVTFQGEEVSLSAKEYSLLELFLRNPQRVFSSSLILEHLWSFEDTPGEETVRTHIKRLRRKLKLAGIQEIIDTVYGMGYRLKPLTDEDLKDAAVSQKSAKNVPISTSAVMANQARKAAIALWEQFREPSLERLAVLDRTVLALQSGNLSQELHNEAKNAAHKLAGSLGMFGFLKGSDLSREIEHWLQNTNQITEFAVFKSLVIRLHQELDPASNLLDDLDPDLLFDLLEVKKNQVEKSSLPSWITNNEKCCQLLNTKIVVLAVDDDSAVLETLNLFLPKWGIYLNILNDSRQVMELLETNTPDLLILDVEMPGINGIEICEMIRRDRTWDGLPILFLSACRDAETIHQLYGAGADDYLAKPFTEAEVVTRIFNRLERNRLLRMLGNSEENRI
ncbi:response regulator [Phormidium sp. LEGE 05292]|uniref:response regulator n=1 Tax=[Phormidium] sp. LEGE 05292 TaxID=767427 RepID=UPI0018822EC5|nr:response regulator [Phormidium sp. LEGE 05292]MBE9225462.1 response regulator [Phormidium sp. LEGE 05292]